MSSQSGFRCAASILALSIATFVGGCGWVGASLDRITGRGQCPSQSTAEGESGRIHPPADELVHHLAWERRGKSDHCVRVAELEDAVASEATGETHAGSTPAADTIVDQPEVSE